MHRPNAQASRWTVMLPLTTIALTAATIANGAGEHADGYRPPGVWLEEAAAAARRGEIADLSTRPIPEIRPGRPLAAGVGTLPCLTPEHIFPFEDTASVLLTNFSDGQLLALMADGANALMAAHGDNYDFVGFFLNYEPDHLIGLAFYMPIFNDIAGLGDPSTVGEPIFDNRVSLGVGGSANLDGYVMMWNVNSAVWAPGDGPDADFTRIAMGQEFEHRFALFLPDLLDGRVMQGDFAGCGRPFHWNWRIDGQGSCMDLSEWVGTNPAIPVTVNAAFSTDIPGGLFGYPDLYLMGYVSPAEMDALTSELRYMNASDCASPYFGPITTFSSADIIAAAGQRVPDATSSQKHFRAGWVMLHLPGDPPDAAELAKAVGILEQNQIDWEYSTLGRGTLSHALFDDCNCNGVPDEEECLGDINEDGSVGTVDLLFLLAAWLNPGGLGDIDCDGFVGTLDLLLLLGAWGPCA